MLLQRICRKFVNSKYLDFFGAALVLFVSIYKNYHSTLYFNKKLHFNVTLEDWNTMMSEGAFPLGLFSIFGAVFSLLSTRYVGKQKNVGNYISIGSTLNSGVIDFSLGNVSAIITYPITFIAHSLSAYRWNSGIKIRKIDSLYYLINGLSIIIGYILVYIGFYLFSEDNVLETQASLFHTIAVTFGLSLGGNFCNVFKYRETFLSWTIYNIIQLIKNSLMLNYANLAKYCFYLFNAIFTYLDWKFNGDRNSDSE